MNVRAEEVRIKSSDLNQENRILPSKCQEIQHYKPSFPAAYTSYKAAAGVKELI